MARRFCISNQRLSESFKSNPADELSHKRSIKVVYRALAVTSKRERVGHISSSIFAKVESVLAVVWMIRVPIRDDHFGK